MSKISEMVKAEADEAEAAEEEEEPEPEPEPTPEPEPEPEPPVGEKALAQMEAENTRHVKRVQQIMGQDFQLVYECPTCSVGPLGFVFEQPGAEPSYRESPDTQLCTTCDGWGKTLSGARDETNRLKVCVPCGGTGYVTKAAQTPNVTYLTPPTTSVTGNVSQPLPYRDIHGNECAVAPDATGRLWGDPGYGHPAPVQTQPASA